MKKILFPMVAVMMVALLGFAGFVVFSLLSNPEETQVVAAQLDYYEYEEYVPVWAETTHYPVNDGTYRIFASTVITYEYYNPATSVFEAIEEYASPMLIGMTRPELAGMFADWQVVEFSPYAVRLQQNSLLYRRQFVITSHEGFIAVFYDDEESGLKELTARPINALPQSEQDRLAQGIKVIGNEELLRALEDFGS